MKIGIKRSKPHENIECVLKWKTKVLYIKTSPQYHTNCKSPSVLGFVEMLSNDSHLQQQSTLNRVKEVMDKITSHRYGNDERERGERIL